jgi:hypothetical protein
MARMELLRSKSGLDWALSLQPTRRAGRAGKVPPEDFTVRSQRRTVILVAAALDVGPEAVLMDRERVRRIWLSQLPTDPNTNFLEIRSSWAIIPSFRLRDVPALAQLHLVPDKSRNRTLMEVCLKFAPVVRQSTISPCTTTERRLEPETHSNATWLVSER